MKIYRAYLPAILLLFLLSASRTTFQEVRVASSTPAVQPTHNTASLAPSKTPSTSATPTAFTYPPDATVLTPETAVYPSRNYSPDRKWYVQVSNTETGLTVLAKSVVTYDLFKDKKIDEIPFTPGRNGRYSVFLSWFPDSTGFIILDTDSGSEKCSFDRMVFFHINEHEKTLYHYVLQPLVERNRAFYYGISFSPDGSKVAMPVDMKSIYVVDLYANVLQKYTPHFSMLPYIHQVVWYRNEVLYTVRLRSEDTYDSAVQLHKIKFSGEQVIDDLLFDAIGAGLSIGSVDPFSPRIILNKDLGPNEQIYTDVDVFNIQTKISEMILCDNNPYQNYYCDYQSSADQEVVAIKAGFDQNLYLYYWKTRELVPQNKNVHSILSWRNDLGGFIVSHEAEPNYWFEVITP